MTVPDLLPVATQAPDFTLPASDGQPLTLSALRGRKHVVLIFYVGDNTPDCNRQLSSLRDDMPELEGLDIVVMGINPAGVEEHARYCTQLPYCTMQVDRLPYNMGRSTRIGPCSAQSMWWTKRA